MPTFASVADLETFMQREFTPEETEWATQLLDFATSVVQGYTGQDFFHAEADVVVLRPVNHMVFLPQLPVLDVISVTDGVDELDGWVLYPSGVLRRSSLWPRLVTVTYTHGYASIPYDVQAACMEVASRAFTNPQGLRQHSKTAGPFTDSKTFAETGVGVTGGVNLSDAEMRRLDRYRLP